MARMVWGDTGNRFFETGVDRGVLYLSDQSGVAWNGLVSVEESPSGGEARPFYQDGVKFLNVSSREEFEATLEAFGAPPEFAPCDGTVSIQKGLFVTQQPRRAFGFSYRTMIGNDVDPLMGYKINLVYNALAAPSSRNNSTMTNSPEATTLSWALTTLPPSFTGYKPTAHFVIDSRYTPVGLLKAVEDILYGTPAVDGRLPEVSELIAMFQSEGPFIARNLATNPSGRAVYTSLTTYRTNLSNNPSPGLSSTKWGSGGGRLTITPTTSGSGMFEGSFLRCVANVAITASSGYLNHTISNIVPATVYTESIYVRPATQQSFQIQASYRDAGGVAIQTFASTTVVCPANVWTRLTITSTAPANSSVLWLLFYNVGTMAIGDTFDVTGTLVETLPYVMDYFSGDYTPDPDFIPAWTGAVQNSTAILQCQVPSGWSAPDIPNGKLIYYSPTRDAVAIRNQNPALWYVNVPWVRNNGSKWSFAVLASVVGPGTAQLFPYFYSNNPVGVTSVPFTESTPGYARFDFDVANGVAGSNAVLRVGANMTQDTTVYVKAMVTDNVYAGPYFDGSSKNVKFNFAHWEGAVDASTSTLNSWN